MVEADDGVVDRERRFREPKDIALRRREPLEATRRLVADITNGSAREARKLRRARALPEARELGPQQLQRIGVFHSAHTAVFEN